MCISWDTPLLINIYCIIMYDSLHWLGIGGNFDKAFRKKKVLYGYLTKPILKIDYNEP